MKIPHKLAACLLVLATTIIPLSTAYPQGTAFTYQGRLHEGANPANGFYDLTFTLFDTNQPGGNVIAGPLTNSATAVSNGLFTLTLDFGNPFDGTARWLEIGVQTNGGNGFTALTPRQLLEPTPYAIRAADAALADAVPPGAITGAMLATGAVASANLAPGAVWRLDTPDASLLGALQVGRDGLIGIGTNDSGAALQVAGGSLYPNPANPVFAASVVNNAAGITNLNVPIRIYVDGTRAYVSSFNPGSLVIFDISNPLAPVVLGEALSDRINPQSPFHHLGGAAGVFVTNNIAYLTAEIDNTLTILDVSDPLNPQKLAELTHGVGGVGGLDTPTDVLVSGTTCYVLSFVSSSLSVFEVSDPSNPRLVKEIFDDSVVAGSPFTKLQYPYQMALAGTKLYIAARGDAAVTVLDVTDPANPALVAEMVDQSVTPASPFTQLRNANGIDMAGSLLYVASGAFGNSGSLTIVDISNPANPVKVSEVADDSVTPGSPFTQLKGAWAVKVAGTTAFVTSFLDNALTAIDVSDPAPPTLAESVRERNQWGEHLEWSRGTCHQRQHTLCPGLTIERSEYLRPPLPARLGGGRLRGHRHRHSTLGARRGRCDKRARRRGSGRNDLWQRQRLDLTQGGEPDRHRAGRRAFGERGPASGRQQLRRTPNRDGQPDHLRPLGRWHC